MVGIDNWVLVEGSTVIGMKNEVSERPVAVLQAKSKEVFLFLLGSFVSKVQNRRLTVLLYGEGQNRMEAIPMAGIRLAMEVVSVDDSFMSIRPSVIDKTKERVMYMEVQ